MPRKASGIEKIAGLSYGEERLLEAEGRDPYGLAEDDHDDGADEAEEPAGDGTPRCRPLPADRHQKDREVAARGHGEGKADHEGDVLVLEDVAEDDRDDADGDGGDLRDADLPLFGDPALGDHGRIEIVADRRGARQGEARDDRQDGGEGDGRDEPEKQGAPVADARWIAAMLVPPIRSLILL